MLMKQKRLQLLLALLTMLSSIGANAESITGTNLTWELTELTGSEGKYTLTISGSGAMPDFNNANKQPWKASRDKIAALVLGSGVTTIGNYAFNSFTNLESVTIPGDVTSIGNNAFGKCTSLTTVSIPNGVTTIGSSAFSGCTSLEEVTIPNGVKVIPNGAFANCTNLKTVNIPSSVEAIDPGAFNKCTSLENITIPNSVKTIQGTAFQNCTSLRSITIPESVETIGQQAFAGCTSLEEVTILATEIGFGSGVFYNTSDNLVIYVPAGSVDTYEAYGNLPENVNIKPITDPTYAVKLADGTQDAANWTIASGENSATGDAADGLTGLKEGDAVTLTYGGRLKVKSVTATTDAKPAGPKAAKDATAEDLGKVIGADGNIYDDADAATAANTTALAKIFYVGSDNGEDAPYNHGLALALGDVSDTKNWCSQTEATCLGTGHQFDSKAGAKGDMAGIDNTDALVNNTGHTHDAASAARNYNSGTHPAGTSAWFLPSAGQWDKMATAAGSYANLINNAGLQGGDAAYWSSTEGGTDYAWFFDSSNGDLSSYGKDYDFQVRACLAF